MMSPGGVNREREKKIIALKQLLQLKIKQIIMVEGLI